MSSRLIFYRTSSKLIHVSVTILWQMPSALFTQRATAKVNFWKISNSWSPYIKDIYLEKGVLGQYSWFFFGFCAFLLITLKPCRQKYLISTKMPLHKSYFCENVTKKLIFYGVSRTTSFPTQTLRWNWCLYLSRISKYMPHHHLLKYETRNNFELQYIWVSRRSIIVNFCS